MFSSRSSRENPRPLVRCLRTSSPSRISAPRPRLFNSPATITASVDFPEHGSPVNHSVNPLCFSVVAIAFWMPSPPEVLPNLPPLRRLRLIRFPQNCGHLRPRELPRKFHAVAQHLPHLRAAQDQAVFRSMPAGLLRSHFPAFAAVKRMVEAHRRDAQLARLEFKKLPLRVVRAVVVPHPGVVPPHDKVRAPVILPRDGVK